ncbi:MAG: hypothetical protein ACREN6_10340 [Gemmatimonadaceae bacterium]
MLRQRLAVAIGFAFVAAVPSVVQAQSRKVRVIAVDSTPIPYAYVAIEGGAGQITDEHGEVSLGVGKKQTLTVRVQRIGYRPWFGKLELPDTGAVLTVQLARIAQSLAAVNVKATAEIRALQMSGFYDRWMMRQKGALSATFIGPEEIEFRHPDKITNMLRGLNGVEMRRSCEGEQVAFSTSNRCQMAILVDGVRQCPSRGCNTDSGGGVFSTGAQSAKPNCDSPSTLNETDAVVIDLLLNADDVAAIEVYSRGANVPVSISASDQACGIIAFWTGSRKP